MIFFKALSKAAPAFANFGVLFGTLLKLLRALSHSEDLDEKFRLNNE